MPAISRRAGEAKSLLCGTMLDLIQKKVGEEIRMNFSDGEIVWRRIQ